MPLCEFTYLGSRAGERRPLLRADDPMEAASEIFDCTECLNGVGTRSALLYLCPGEFERANWPEKGCLAVARRKSRADVGTLTGLFILN